MAHKDFDLTPSEADPPTFTVAGREFKCVPEPPGGALADLFWTFQGTETVLRAAGLVRFISACLPDAEAESFELVIHDKDTIIPIAVLHDIATWLIEEYTGRPTTPSSGSATGSGITAATSEDGSASAELVATDSAQ